VARLTTLPPVQPAQIRPAAGTGDPAVRPGVRPSPRSPQSGPNAPQTEPPKRRPGWLVAGILAAVLIVAFAAFFLVRWTNDDQSPAVQQAAVPAPCTLLNTELTEKIVPGGALRQDGTNCSVEGANPQQAPKITMSVNSVPQQGAMSAEEAATRYVTEAFKDGGKTLDGIGDNAAMFEPANSGTVIILLRVKTFVVSLTASVPVTDAKAAGPVEAAKTLATDVAQRLRAKA
jgi:hypothetical protein